MIDRQKNLCYYIWVLKLPKTVGAEKHKEETAYRGQYKKEHSSSMF